MSSNPDYGAVYCAGLLGGGSVLQYLLTKELVCEAYDPRIPVLRLIHFEDYLVPHIEQGKAKLVLMHRDFRDAYYTMIRRRLITVDWVGMGINDERFNNVMDIKGIKHLEWFKQWEECEPNINFRYEDFYPDKWHLMIQKMAEFLDLKVTRNKAKKIAEMYSLDNNLERQKIADGSSLLEWNHIGANRGAPGAHEWAFSDEQLAQFEELAGDWLTEHGYELTIDKEK